MTPWKTKSAPERKCADADNRTGSTSPPQSEAPGQDDEPGSIHQAENSPSFFPTDETRFALENPFSDTALRGLTTKHNLCKGDGLALLKFSLLDTAGNRIVAGRSAAGISEDARDSEQDGAFSLQRIALGTSLADLLGEKPSGETADFLTAYAKARQGSGTAFVSVDDVWRIASGENPEMNRGGFLP